MLTRRVIPCLDVDGGRVVKGTAFESIRDAGDPVELARRYAEGGADELVFLDITASEQKRAIVSRLVSDVARVIDVPFTVGGGVGSMEDARAILMSGADKVGVNTGAVNDPGLLGELMRVFGRQCVVIAIDARRVAGEKEGGTMFEEGGERFWYEVCTYGGKKGTGLDAVRWAKKAAGLGAGEVLLTSIDRDGTKDGYDCTLVRAVSGAVPVPVIASGGCGSAQHMVDVFGCGADAALAASIFHYGEEPVLRVKEALRDGGIPVRL